MKAIGLLSGGLDSQLAIRLMLEQGIDMVAVHFRTIFCTCPSTVSSGRSHRTPKGCGKSVAYKVAGELDIPFVEFNNTREFLNIVRDPPHGYGRGMNPCIDCRILMLKKAREYMEGIDASFIVTGEVIAQRPMSQHKRTMDIIEKESGLCGLIVRPLSGRLLPPTIPEQRGWIDRNKLLAHSGRSRKLQIELAERFSIRDYPCAAGGCLLTDPGFSRRIKESFQYGEYSLGDVQLLKIGRHFRLLNRVKLVVGRNEIENNRIMTLARKDDILIEPVNVPGPLTLLRTSPVGLIRKDLCNINEDFLRLAMYICARYCDGNGNKILRYGLKDGARINWDKEVVIKLPDKPVVIDDYCRRI